MTTVAIIAPYSLAKDQSDFALSILPTKRHIATEQTTVTICSLHIRRPPTMIIMSELPPFTTPNYPFQQARYYIPKYQQEPLRTDLLDLLPFPRWYKGLGLGLHMMPTQSTAALPTYPTDRSIRRNATILYYMVRVAPALTAITTKAYLPALATKFRIGPRITSWTYGKHRTETPLPATPDKNLL